MAELGESNFGKLTRRRFIRRLSASGAVLYGLPASGAESTSVGSRPALIPLTASRVKTSTVPVRFWWQGIPTFAQIEDPTKFLATHAVMDIHGFASDPTWGPYAQRLTILESGAHSRAIKAAGARTITWMEGFGDCMLYAITLQRAPDGKFQARNDDPGVPRVFRSHWDWAHSEIPQGNTFRWVGLHNTVNDEDFVGPAFTRERTGVPIPTYPDGRPALGWIAGVPYPLGARVYDACGAKDVNGKLRPAFELTSRVNDVDPATGLKKGPVEGLLAAVVGIDDVAAPPGAKKGDTVYCGVVSIHKDLSAPFWREYARVSARTMAEHGVDGIWCDNYSPWDNFGYPPVQKAFGEWSVHLFHQSLRQRLSAAQWKSLGVETSAEFDVRKHLKRTVSGFGAKDAGKLDDATWHDSRWLDDPVWNAFKAFRQRQAKHDLAAFYHSIHEAAAKAGRPDFCIGGNDIPFYGLGWVQDSWLDMVNTELTPGWHMGAGTRGIMIPPLGKMAVIYRIAREHQKGPIAAGWYYLNGAYSKHQNHPVLAQLLLAEAFANGAVLMCDPDNHEVAGSVEVHARWNRFIQEHRDVFEGRTPMGTIGVLFSPDNQLALLAPGGFPDMDRQPHIFGHYGWATALIDSHVPYQVIPDWKLTPAGLKGLTTLILPDVECLETESVNLLERWVRSGGRLLISGSFARREGPAGEFRRRREHTFAGSPTLAGSDTAVSRRLGKGSVTWSTRSFGMEYYLASTERKTLLPAVYQMGLGSAAPYRDVINGQRLPPTVGLFPWSRAGALSLDLVNYDIDVDADRLSAVQDLSFGVRLPAAWAKIELQTSAPETVPPATAVVRDGWAEIHLPRLEQFCSVRITPGR